MEAIKFDKNGQPILTDHEKEIVFELIERFIDIMPINFRSFNSNGTIVNNLINDNTESENSKIHANFLCDALGVLAQEFKWEKCLVEKEKDDFKYWLMEMESVYGSLVKIRILNKKTQRLSWCLLLNLSQKRWTKNYVVETWNSSVDDDGRVLFVTIKGKKETKE